jgi:hypothetical protein
MRRHSAFWLLLGAASVGSTAGLAQPTEHSDAESGLSAKFGYDWTAGKYGQSKDSTASVGSLTLTSDFKDYSVDFVLPYLRQTGPGKLIGIAGRRPIVVIGPDQKESGMGDVTGGITRYVLNEEDHQVDLDVGAIVKFATASAGRGLGSGKYDYSLQAALGRSFAGFVTTLTGGYTFVGRPPNQGYRDAFYGSLDLSHNWSESISLGFTYSAGGTIITGLPGTRDGQAYVSFKPAKGVKVEVYYLKGWSTQSPDRGAGISVACDL